MITTTAWLLQRGASGRREPAELRLGTYTFPDLSECEALVEPIYGCWEGNMTHAVTRHPIDICEQRGEEQVVIGNAGVVRILRTGQAITDLREGDLCLVFCSGIWDDHDYPKQIYGYDAPGTVGLLAKQSKLHRRQLIRLPDASRHSPRQWAAFSLRYITAWANWKIAYGCWRAQQPAEVASPTVWGWGGGVTLAEVCLARHFGCRVAMISSNDARLALMDSLGITPIDRRSFAGLDFDPERYQSDAAFKHAYRRAEETFLDIVKCHTAGRGVSIFIDFVGQPVFRATLKALSRPGIVTTAGWKQGMNLGLIRAVECMNWHTHVHTHYARYFEGLEAVAHAEQHAWIPPLDDQTHEWGDIPRLASEYGSGQTSSYFPLFQVNSL